MQHCPSMQQHPSSSVALWTLGASSTTGSARHHRPSAGHCHRATATGFAGRQSCMGVRGVCVRMFFQPAQPNFGKSEAISYVNPSKFRPGGQQQFSYSQTPRSRQDLRGVRGVCVRLPTVSNLHGARCRPGHQDVIPPSCSAGSWLSERALHARRKS